MLPKITLSYRLKKNPDPILDIEHPLLPKTNRTVKNHLKKKIMSMSERDQLMMQEYYLNSFNKTEIFKYQVKYSDDEVVEQRIHARNERDSELKLNRIIGDEQIKWYRKVA